MECVKIENYRGIEIRTVRDDNGQYSRLYREKGKLLQRLILEGFYIEQMKAFRSLDKDLRNILTLVGILNELNAKNDFLTNRYPGMDNRDAAVFKGLFFAILALYGRCFTGAQNRKFTFDKKHVPEKYRKYHDDLMHMRHNFAAHKGDFEAEDCQIALVLNIKKKVQISPQIFSELQQPYIDFNFLDKGDGTPLEDICTALKGVIAAKYEDLYDKIIDGFVLTVSPSFWKNADGKTVNIDPYFKKR